jgi:hypothetical protein
MNFIPLTIIPLTLGFREKFPSALSVGGSLSDVFGVHGDENTFSFPFFPRAVTLLALVLLISGFQEPN